MNAGTSRCG